MNALALFAVAVQLSVPQYRNNFYPGQCADRVAGRTDAGAAVSIAGEGVRAQSATAAADGSFAFDTAGLAEGGAATLTVTAGGETKTVRIRRLAPTGRQMVWIENGNLVVNGRKVLRRNVYAVGYRGGTKLDEAFKRNKDAFHLTPEFARKVSVEPEVLIPGLEAREAKKDVRPCDAYFAKLDEVIEKNRDTDFGAYYLCDEPEMRKISSVYLKHIYDYLVEKDPYHPVFMATTSGKRFIECIDWGETHPYLDVRLLPDGSRQYGHPPSAVGGYMDAFGAANRPDKVIGFLPTCFSYRYCGSSREDYPTFEELVLHTWAGMIHGGKSLWAYAYHDLGDRPGLWLGLQYLYASFDVLQSFFLDARRTMFDKTPDHEGVLYELGDEKMFALVNFTTKPVEVALKGFTGDFGEFRGARRFTGGGKVKLAPQEVVVATTVPHDAGLESFADVQARVAAAERARTHRDNQLLERYDDILFSANFSGVHGGTFHKLIDGMYGQVARSSVWEKKDLWLEAAFVGFRPRFDRALIHGFGIVDRARFSVRRDGAWRELNATVTKRGKYLFEFDFGETVSTVRLRIDFPSASDAENKLEIYELELPRTDSSGTSEAAAKPSAPDPDRGVTWRKGPVSPETHTTYPVKVDGETEWYVVRPTAFRDKPVNKYRAWMFCTEKCGYLCGAVSHPQPGLYTIRVPRYADGTKTDHVQHYGYEMAVDYASVAAMACPANRVEVETEPGKADVSVGDVLKVRAHFATPVEEVVAETYFADMYLGVFKPFSLAKGTHVVEMKPCDGTKKVWEGELTVDRCPDAKKRNFYFKVTGLGGGLDAPMFTNLPIPFVKERKK